MVAAAAARTARPDRRALPDRHARRLAVDRLHRPARLGLSRRPQRLAKRTEPKWISDHLCWTGVHGVNLHDLLPIPYTREALDHVVARVGYVQERSRAATLPRERV